MNSWWVLSAALLTGGAMAPAQPLPTSVRPFATGQPPLAANEDSGRQSVHVHDPSTIIQADGVHRVFYTGWGIPSYQSSNLITWQTVPPVFTQAPAWVKQLVPAHRGLFFWAPEILQLDHRYLLYYAVSTFGRNVSAIGLATNTTLNPADPRYHWVDCGPVVHSTEPDDFNAIDPSIAQGADGSLWMSYGSFWSGIKLIQLNPATGKRIAPASRVWSLARNDSIEASYLWRRQSYYYLFVNWGLCCRGTNSTYEVRVGRSRQITGPYLDDNQVDMLEDGGTEFLKTDGPFIGPGQIGILQTGTNEWLSCHFYDGRRKGRSTLAILPLHWNARGWPETSAPPNSGAAWNQTAPASPVRN